MADDRKPSWRLEGAAIIAAENPYTFYKPSADAIALLRPDNRVKLIFAFDSDDPAAPAAQRMWVKIAGIEGERFHGVLSYVSLGAVLKQDDSFRDLLDTPAPCAYARDAGRRRFIAE